MRAVFVGKDGSLGFKQGKLYFIKTRLDIRKRLFKVDTPLIILTGKLSSDDDVERSCPYSSVEAMMENWKIV